MKLSAFLSQHYEALKTKAEARFKPLDGREADEEARFFRSQFMPNKWRKLLEIVETAEDPNERAEELDATAEDSPLGFQVMLRPGQANLNGLGKAVALLYLTTLLRASLTPSEEENLIDHLAAIEKLWKSVLERKGEARDLRDIEEKGIRHALASSTIINVEEVVAVLKKLKDSPERTGQYL